MSLLAKIRREERSPGFTLLEILMVVALIGVATTLFIVSAQSLGRAAPADDLEATFWKAIAAARSEALTSRRPVEISFNEEARAFVVRGSTGESTFATPTSALANGEEITVTFTQDKASNELTLVRGELITTRPVDAVRIFPDGTCQPFNIEFNVGKRKQRVKIDPWTGGAMLPDPKSQGGLR